MLPVRADVDRLGSAWATNIALPLPYRVDTDSHCASVVPAHAHPSIVVSSRSPCPPAASSVRLAGVSA